MTTLLQDFTINRAAKIIQKSYREHVEHYKIKLRGYRNFLEQLSEDYPNSIVLKFYESYEYDDGFVIGVADNIIGIEKTPCYFTDIDYINDYRKYLVITDDLIEIPKSGLLSKHSDINPEWLSDMIYIINKNNGIIYISPEYTTKIKKFLNKTKGKYQSKATHLEFFGEKGTWLPPYIIYSEKENKAATIIQKYFRECRYNPVYKLCQQIFKKQLHLILDSYEINGNLIKT